jgi:hypothetical protein
MQPQQPLTPADPHPGAPYPQNPFAAAPYQGRQYPVSPFQRAQQRSAVGFGQSPAGFAHWALPVGRSWQSITAGYVALIAIVAWFLGPVALGLGVWALVKASRDGSHGRGRAIFAVVVGLLASMLFAALLATT